MCNLCSTDPAVVNDEKCRLYDMEKRLNDVARSYRDFAYGDLDPHGDACKAVAAKAHYLIRELVNEWM